MDYQQKEFIVIDFVEQSASCDELASLYAYMNCITVSDFTNGGIYAFDNTNEPLYIVESTQNEDIMEGDYVYWAQIDKYLTDLINGGCQDDIECAYGFIS